LAAVFDAAALAGTAAAPLAMESAAPLAGSEAASGATVLTGAPTTAEAGKAALSAATSCTARCSGWTWLLT
jgi:hypothetical protein